MRPMTKIIATLGDPDKGTYPENGICDSKGKLRPRPTLQDVVDMFVQSGADVIRINMAHVSPTDFLRIKKAILTAERRFKRKIGLLVDLPGPKIRFKSAFILPAQRLTVCLADTKEEITLPTSESNNKPPVESKAIILLGHIPFASANPEASSLMTKEIEKRLSEEHRPILAFIGDSGCTLKVIGVDSKTQSILCTIKSFSKKDRTIHEGTGFTIRGISKPINSFTQEDGQILSALLEADYKSWPRDDRILSYIGLSFCQTREDVRRALIHIINWLMHQKIKFHQMPIKDILLHVPMLIAKIETQKGVDNIHSILDFADGVMIARGDLALEMETVDLPSNSKHITRKANLRGKLVIMATQMLESMKSNPECSRSEAVDVFNAVTDGADALLLAGETSSGQCPSRVIEKAKELASRADEFLLYKKTEDDIIGSYSGILRKLVERVKKLTIPNNNLWDTINQEYFDLWSKKDIDDETYTLLTQICKIKKSRLDNQYSTDRISLAACIMSADEKVVAIVSPTTSSRTARMIARFRPRVWVIAQPHTVFIERKLTMDRGVEVKGILPTIKDRDTINDIMNESRKQLSGHNIQGTVIFTCGTPLGTVGSTNLLQRWESV